MLTRRHVLGLGAGAFGAATLAACSGFTNDPDPTQEAGAGDGTTPQTLMCWADPTQADLFRTTLAKFTEESGIEVEVVSVTSQDYFQRINSMVSSNSLPDVFWASPSSGVIGPLAANNELYDWTELLNAPPEDAPLDISQFGPGYLDLFTHDGKVVGVPNEVNINGVYINKEAFARGGVELPTSEWTWDDLFSAAAALASDSAEGYGLQTGMPAICNSFGASMYSLSQGSQGIAGEESLTFQGIRSVQTTPEFVEAAERFVAAIGERAINGPDFSTANSIATFMAGDVPMLYGGQWFTAFFAQELEMDWGFVTAPRGSAGHPSILEANAFCSPANLADPLATFKMIQYMLTTGFNEAYAEYGITPQAYTPGSEGFYSFLEKKAESEPGYGEVAEAVKLDLANPLKHGTSFLDNWANQAEDITKAIWNPMLNGNRPVAEATEEFVSRIQDLIDT